jgi:hypothetical protein
MSGLRDSLFCILVATLQIWRPSPRSAIRGRAMLCWQGPAWHGATQISICHYDQSADIWWAMGPLCQRYCRWTYPYDGQLLFTQQYDRPEQPQETILHLKQLNSYQLFPQSEENFIHTKRYMTVNSDRISWTDCCYHSVPTRTETYPKWPVPRLPHIQLCIQWKLVSHPKGRIYPKGIWWE